MKKTLLLFLTAFMFIMGIVRAQQNIIATQSRVASSFAIFIDDKSYEACKDAVMAYKDMLEKEGLATYLLVADWEGPEHVKYFLEKYYNEQAMEGAVFIGNIPIPMVRKAQHMTSAFKMSEKAFGDLSTLSEKYLEAKTETRFRALDFYSKLESE